MTQVDRYSPVELPQVAVGNYSGRRLWSWWDMLFKLGASMELLETIQELRRVYSEKPDLLDLQLNAADKVPVESVYSSLQGNADGGGFETVQATLKHARAELQQGATVRQVVERLKQLDENYRHDAEHRHFWLLHRDKQQYAGRGFSDRVSTAFPDAVWEIKEAGSCYALARNTASVFHLMRGVEIAMRAVAIGVGVPSSGKTPLEYREWNQVIEQIESYWKAIEQQWGNGAELTNARQFFKRIVADLHSFKDDVRNVTMHTRDKPYDSPGALSVRNRVKDWFELLAKRVVQDIQPGSLLDKSLFAP